LFILHVALQGALRGRNVEYGITADTGGHIRYLMGLVHASEKDAAIERITIATRAFRGSPGDDYWQPRETVTRKIEIVRFSTDEPGYLPKKELWHEVPSFADALINWIEQQPKRPDILHAHYADAGAVASVVRERVGIPFIFTSHSLGRMKLDAFSLHKDGGANLVHADNLEHRLQFEERALADAALVVASSRDEAELQYAGYDNHVPGKIRVIPPGVELAMFTTARSSIAVDRMINRFLDDPDKPPIIAIARPVTKKNLCTLVEAFGESVELQSRANLVLIAGTRTDIDELEPELAENLFTILKMIDRYDLYGKVAYPKDHRPEDLPALYAYARERRGVFVNPAFNEPFGLTLLEAAAVGIPVIATESGGPNDIVAVCGNGEVVNPTAANIADAAARILKDPALWHRYAASGAVAVEAFNWQSHANRYHSLLRSLLLPRVSDFPEPTELLITDIDNTLVGERDAHARFCEWLSRQTGVVFGIATGRSFHSSMMVLEQEASPRPQVMITSVGSEIYYLTPDSTTYVQDDEWSRFIDVNWDPDVVVEVLKGCPGIRPQAAIERRRFKLSYLTSGDNDLVARLRERLEAAGLRCTMIHSHGRYLDILPVRASKGAAVTHVRNRYGLSEEQVFVAGDSANDTDMLRALPQAIIVQNFSDDLANLPELQHAYFASKPYASGIIEGVDHFRIRTTVPA
jgi:sucrose-phosphate synthase